MKHKTINFILFSMILFGCKNLTENVLNQKENKQSLYGTWILSDLKNLQNNPQHEEDKLLAAAEDKSLVKEGLILSFFPDNSFTQIKGSGAYRFGKWNYKKKDKLLCLKDSISKDSTLITFETLNDRQFIHLINFTKKEIMSFVKQTGPLKDYAQDPFYSMNNAWRIKPLRPETDEELHQRLGNYFKHLAYLLQSASERKLPSITFTYSKGIVKIYNGGIGISPIIPESWEKAYYNSEDASIAHEMFGKYLATSSYRGAGTGDWYKDDFDILTSIYRDVKAGKFPKRKTN